MIPKPRTLTAHWTLDRPKHDFPNNELDLPELTAESKPKDLVRVIDNNEYCVGIVTRIDRTSADVLVNGTLRYIAFSIEYDDMYKRRAEELQQMIDEAAIEYLRNML